MELVATGKLIKRLEKRSGVSQQSGRAWASIEYVIQSDEQYPKKLAFTVFGEDAVNKAIDNLHTDDLVTVTCNVDANEYNGKFYNQIRAWKIEKNGTDVLSGQTTSTPQASVPQNNGTTTNEIQPSATAPKSELKQKVAETSQQQTEDDLPF